MYAPVLEIFDLMECAARKTLRMRKMFCERMAMTGLDIGKYEL